MKSYNETAASIFAAKHDRTRFPKVNDAKNNIIN